MKCLTLPLLLVLVTTSLVANSAAKYNGEDRGRPVMPAQSNARWQAECGSCHMAFPPGLLPAASWTKMMAGLDKHFETDASLSPQDVQTISGYLTLHASNRWTSTAAPLRITDSAWFKTKHRPDEINPAVWKRASVKSQANCMACHPGADKGDFNERNIRIPK
ncbi:MAG: diheme cytochrome c [Rhodoferax sp.]|uniref:diheme cytochrome c n=1 Tax=Rhodoferax sp. TaxID=50421 RepID=UPI001B5E301B|nr:diheme cytochrome c [Rhodoferax sp.]MBP9904798.1 diheme cytochrome c [Rhodoferax sp.]